MVSYPFTYVVDVVSGGVFPDTRIMKTTTTKFLERGACPALSYAGSCYTSSNQSLKEDRYGKRDLASSGNLGSGIAAQSNPRGKQGWAGAHDSSLANCDGGYSRSSAGVGEAPPQACVSSVSKSLKMHRLTASGMGPLNRYASAMGYLPFLGRLRVGSGWNGLDAQPLADSPDGKPDRAAGVASFARCDVRNSGLTTPRLLSELLLGQSRFDDRGDVVFPLHTLHHIGLPMFKQVVYRYRFSVCLPT